MNPPDSSSAPRAPAGQPVTTEIREAAARWVIRRDRGLSPAEQAGFQQWLDADPRHAAALARSTGAWSLLAKLPAAEAPEVNLPARRPLRWRWAALGGLAAAIVVGGLLLRDRPVAVAVAATEAPLTRVLSDRSVVRLNRGAELVEEFTRDERRVRLIRGEAHFAVNHDTSRAFIVRAGPIVVRALGTAFNVRIQQEAVDVLVTEGVVHVAHPIAAAVNSGPIVTAGHRAVVALAAPLSDQSIAVRSTTAEEVGRELAWREPLLRLGGATLAEIAAQFERNTGRRLVLDDAALAELRIGGRFPSDDVEGFVRVLEQSYGVVCTREANGTLRLGKKP